MIPVKTRVRWRVGHGSWRWPVRVGLMLAALSPMAVRAGEEPVPEAREPIVRHVDRREDAEAKKRVWYYRNRLPAEFQRMNNFAWARADIPGLRKKEYYAHSRIQSLDNLSSRAARKIQGISPQPDRETARFRTLFVDFEGNIGGPNAIPRWFDTEYKILEDIAARLPDPSVEGRILMYTYLEPCLSCRGVMEQFMAIYTNVEMEVIYEWP